MDATPFDLSVRHQVYRSFADTGQPPRYPDLAAELGVPAEEVRQAFHRLHARHMIFLEPGGDAVRMANPFSAVPTRFKVRSGTRAWWANCAWDSLGIPAALQIDVDIVAAYPDGPETADLQVRQGTVDGKGHVVYFPLPFSRWYDDLVFT